MSYELSEVVATVSLVLDSPLGLPMEEIYPGEIAALRRAGRKIAEVSALSAVRAARGAHLSMYANKLMIAYAQYAGVDDLGIAVNPRHADFYEKFLLFEPLGGLQSYSKVKGAPALASRLDMNTVEERARAVYGTEEFDANLYTFFFTRDREAHSSWLMAHSGDQPRATSYEPQRRPGERIIMTPELLRYFFVEKTDAFRQAPPEALARVRACYPFYDFRRILGEVR